MVPVDARVEMVTRMEMAARMPMAAMMPMPPAMTDFRRQGLLRRGLHRTGSARREHGSFSLLRRRRKRDECGDRQ
jgi:hypothetical protein